MKCCRPRRSALRRVFCLGLALALPGIARGQGGDCGCEQFTCPRRVTNGAGHATQTAAGLDIANNAYIASVIEEKIRVKIIGPALDAEVPIAANGLGQGDPDFATTSSGITYMSFSQLDENTPGEGREVYLTDNQGGGGQFKAPINISKSRVDDYASRLVLDQQSRPHLAWVQRIGEQTRVMYWSQALGDSPPIPAAQGDYPHLFVDERGIVHLVYSRQNDLFYNSNDGGAFTNELRVTTTALEPESSASIGVDPQGTVLISYESRNSLYFASRPTGAAFRPPVLVDAGGVLDPKMRVRSRGQVALVYSKGGDIYYVVGQSTFLAFPQRICEPTPEVENHPSLEIDLQGNVHVSFLREGEVYYTNNAKAIFAEFSAVPPVGEVPLKTRFGDLSSGGIEVWNWDFGDGERSTEQNPTHTYVNPGKYTVTLTVSGPGGASSSRVKEDFIFVQDPYYTMRLPDQRVAPGQADVWFPLITKRKDRTQGFQVMATYDPSFLLYEAIDFTNSVLSGRRTPEFYQVNDLGTRIEIGCVYEFSEPIDQQNVYLEAGENQTLLSFIFDVSENAPQGAQTKVDLINIFSVSRIFNIFIVEGFTRLPALTGSTVDVIVLEPPFPRLFVRGDADGTGKVDISDAVKILNYLFLGGDAPPCLDAADVNDKGKVDISSAVSLLSFLFTGGAQPAVPFPNKGLDPTADDLSSCVQ